MVVTGEKNMENTNVIFEDNHLLVVIKPQNIPVQEDESKDKDLLTMLKEYLVEKYNKPGKAYLGLVHRLDRPTGGVMVFAKTSKAAERLCEQIKTGEFEKTYLTVVDGEPRIKADRLSHYLKKNEKTNTVEVVPSLEEGAKKAELDYKVLETKDDLSLVKIKLLTGRSHQIRVQMKTLGTPVYSDLKYGKEKKTKAPTKMSLWATDLKFNHPVTKQRMSFRVYPPKDEMPWNKFNLDKFLETKVEE
jgi:23S rRNA pseudouridine1911/1915/1917 synthase